MSLAFEVCGTAAMSALGGLAQPLTDNGGGFVRISFGQFADPVHGLGVNLTLALGDVDQLGGAARYQRVAGRAGALGAMRAAVGQSGEFGGRRDRVGREDAL